MTTESMKQRLRRVAAQAAQKKKASRREARRRLIARLEKDATDVKSRSFEEQTGGGKGSAADEYDRKSNLPKPKGDDPKLDYDWEAGEGYPNEGTSSAGLGSGGPDAGGKSKSKQQALDEASEKNKKNTSEMEEVTKTDPSRPRPKLSAAKRRAWRKKRIAELKQALSKNAFNPEGDPEMKQMFQKMEEDDAAARAPRTKGVAPKEVRVKADQLQKTLGKALAQFLPKLQEANDNLEMAVTGGKLAEIKGALGQLLTTTQFVMKNVLVPQGGQLQKLMMGLRQASAKDERFKVTYTRLARMDEELSRARTLIRMAAGHVRI